MNKDDFWLGRTLDELSCGGEEHHCAAEKVWRVGGRRLSVKSHPKSVSSILADQKNLDHITEFRVVTARR